MTLELKVPANYNKYCNTCLKSTEHRRKLWNYICNICNRCDRCVDLVKYKVGLEITSKQETKEEGANQ